MSRELRLCLLGAFVLVVLAGCGRNYIFGQRDGWRHDAEMACLKSGAVKESAGLVRIEPIQGPGVCGADFPLKVAALAETSAIAYADDLRPPGSIPGAPPAQPKWPIVERRVLPAAESPRMVRPTLAPAISSAAPGPPLSIAPPGLEPARAALDRHPPSGVAPAMGAPRRPSVFDPPGSPTSRDGDDDEEPLQAPAAKPRPVYERATPVPLKRAPLTTGAIVPVELKPAATLACPIVSALDQWIAGHVQPAAMRWFGRPVVEIKQISAYSCRGMNGNANAHISEHAFGNALDIAAFTLDDGRKITVREGWRGRPEEQGFLRDIQGAACEQFSTVLAPGSNAFHYDHIHVDLMRRASGRIVCEPGAVPGDVVAARAAREGRYARRGEPSVTGSIGAAKNAEQKTSAPSKWRPLDEEDEDAMEELDSDEPHGGPGED